MYLDICHCRYFMDCFIAIFTILHSSLFTTYDLLYLLYYTFLFMQDIITTLVEFIH